MQRGAHLIIEDSMPLRVGTKDPDQSRAEVAGADLRGGHGATVGGIGAATERPTPQRSHSRRKAKADAGQSR